MFSYIHAFNMGVLVKSIYVVENLHFLLMFVVVNIFLRYQNIYLKVRLVTKFFLSKHCT